jgi:hypothetical protein
VGGFLGLVVEPKAGKKFICHYAVFKETYRMKLFEVNGVALWVFQGFGCWL